MTDVFLHNPRCSKSRAALDLVRASGVELPVREYLQDPLSTGELRRIVELLGVRPIDLVRRGDFAGMPLAVTIAGSIHGFLFVALVLMLMIAVPKVPITVRLAAAGVVAAIVPGGPFFLERRLARIRES